MIPFFGTVVMKNSDLKAAMMGAVVLNLTGLINGLLHLLLRSNTASSSFGSEVRGMYDEGKYESRMGDQTSSCSTINSRILFGDLKNQTDYQVDLKAVPTLSEWKRFARSVWGR